MNLSSFVNNDNEIVSSFNSTTSVIPRLLKKKYLVVEDDESFVGLLTPRDIVENYHNLVVDCLCEKPLVHINDDINDVITVMDKSGFRALPVFSESEVFIGIVAYEKILSSVCSLVHHHVEVKNITSCESSENSRLQLFRELQHHTRNPLQVILSAVYELSQKYGNSSDQILFKTIEEEVCIIDEILISLLDEYDRNI